MNIEAVSEHDTGEVIKLKFSYLKFFFVLVLLTGCSFGGSPVPGNQGHKAYRVQKGDTLWKIGKKFSVSPELLTQANNIADPSALKVGMWIKVPDSSYRSKIGASRASIPVNYTRISSASSNSNLQRKAILAWPIRTGRFSSGFGPRGRRFHDGLDISAKPGTPIYASQSGVVAYSNSGLSGYGRSVIIKGDRGIYTIYAHAKTLYVKEGQRVVIGQKIAETGSTGRCSGPHLHFEVRTKDRYGRFVAVDPIPLLDRFATRKPRFRVNESLNHIFAKVGR